VVLRNGVSPTAEPIRKRSRQASTFQGVTLQDFPFDLVGLTGLVQYRAIHGEFSDVMQQSGPPEAIAIVLGQFELIGDEIGHHTDAF
jgi:hypothetical protein